MWKQKIILKSLGKCIILFYALLFFNSCKEETLTFTITENSIPTIVIVEGESVPVTTASVHFKTDVATISGIQLKQTKTYSSENTILVGTIGKSSLIDSLINAGILAVSEIEGKSDAYLIKTLPQNSIAIVGADSRGTAYGLYALSEKIGVSPWHWFADVHPEKKQEINLEAIEETWVPTVKYRGIFINDEIWGIQTWSKKNFAPDEKLLGPRVYEKVFELLMRLKANHIWPSMWGKGKKPEWPAFYSQQGNIDLANKYGIVMGASHGESLNTSPSEWASWTKENEQSHEWNYAENYPTMKAFWEERLEISKQVENLYTVGLRGLNDEPMEGGSSQSDKIKIVEEAIRGQRELIEKVTGKPASEVPQIFCPYKEVLPLFENGLQVPDDVTVLYTDDNFGYIREIPSLEPRKGGYGMYYHLDYYGGSKSYIWMGGQPMALVNLEMQKSFDLGIQTAWIANVGNIKMHEPVMEFFLHLAANIGTERELSPQAFTKMWASREFSPEVANLVEEVLTEMERLNFVRKPDHAMQGQFSLSEGERFLSDYEKIIQKAEEAFQLVPAHRKDAFQQLVLFPVKASYLNHALFFYETQQYKHRVWGSKKAEEYVRLALQCREELTEETRIYNEEISDGKWNHFMYGPQGGHNWKVPWKPNFEAYQPEIKPIKPNDESNWGVLVEGTHDLLGNTWEAIESKQLQLDTQQATDFFEELEEWDSKGNILTSKNQAEKLAWQSLGEQNLLIAESTNQDFELTLEVNASKRVGLVFGFKDAENFAWAEIAKNSMDTQIGLVIGGSRVPLTWNEQYRWPIDEWKQLRLIKKADKVELYVDDVLLMYTTHPYLESLFGKVGLSCREGEMQVRALQLTLTKTPEQPHDTMPLFVEGKSEKHFFEILNQSTESINWVATPSHEWLLISEQSGSTKEGNRVGVSIDWNKLGETNSAQGTIEIEVADETKKVQVVAHKRTDAEIVAEGHITELLPSNGINNAASTKTGLLEHLGWYGEMLEVKMPQSIAENELDQNTPFLTYNLDIQQEGKLEVRLQILPTRPVYPAKQLRYAVAIGEETPQVVDLKVRSNPWGITTLATLHGTAVFNNQHIGFTNHQIQKSGKQKLKIWSLDNGLVISSINVRINRN